MRNANRPLSYTDDVETIPADEADDIQRVIQAMEMILARTQAKSGKFRADVHVKLHGYAQGELRVLPNLPDGLAQGLFEHEGVYRTVVRFAECETVIDKLIAHKQWVDKHGQDLLEMRNWKWEATRE
jgi:hypothetical protein